MILGVFDCGVYGGLFMKKCFIRLFALLAAAVLVLTGCTAQVEEKPVLQLSEYNYQNTPPGAKGAMLSVADGRLVDASGTDVRLVGVNLGNWMLMETWMSFIEKYSDEWGYYDTLEVLHNRFGEERTAQLIQAYEDNFITQADIAQIEKLGFNCVRVPFWYRNFMTEDGYWIADDPDENPGFMRLDWLIEQCREHNIYVILDLHGAPGGQSMNHSTGKAGRNTLYTDAADMETAVRLWTGIAERYCDEDTVAAYDLLNEPQNNGGYEGENAWQAESDEAVERTNRTYDTLYKAVRSVDENHIISFEGIWSADVLPDPEENGYTNMMYQMHLYDTKASKIRSRVKEMTKMRNKWGVALLVGEYNNGEEEAYANSLYQENGISTTKWTYKTFNAGSQWGIFNKDTERIDINTASYDEIMDYIQNEISTDSFAFNAEEMAAIS